MSAPPPIGPDDIARHEERERLRYKWYRDTYSNAGTVNHGRGAYALVGPGAYAVDVGCGDNSFIRALAALPGGVRGIGIDLDDPRADVLAPAWAIPFNDKTFDVVTAFDVLEHIHPRLINTTLDELRRVSHRFVFSICYKASPVGLHLTVKPERWWLDTIEAYGTPTTGEGYIFGEWA